MRQRRASVENVRIDSVQLGEVLICREKAAVISGRRLNAASEKSWQ